MISTEGEIDSVGRFEVLNDPRRQTASSGVVALRGARCSTRCRARAEVPGVMTGPGSADRKAPVFLAFFPVLGVFGVVGDPKIEVTQLSGWW